MLPFSAVAASDLAALPESEVVALARAGRADAVRFIVQAHNQKLYRVARAVLHDDNEAEDVVQEVYVRALLTLDRFRGESSLRTWLTRIAINEALGRLRRRRPKVDLDALDSAEERDRVISFPLTRGESDPEQAFARQEVRRLLERAIDQLAEPFRIVFVLRDVEDMSAEETAELMGLRPETVRTRLHRARAQLRKALQSQLASALDEIFPFGGARCVRLTNAVLRRLAALQRIETTKEEKL